MDSEGSLEMPDDPLCLNDPAVAFVSVPKSTREAFQTRQGVSLNFHNLFPNAAGNGNATSSSNLIVGSLPAELDENGSCMLRELSAQVDDLVESDDDTNDYPIGGSYETAPRTLLSKNNHATTFHEYSDPSVVSAYVNNPTIPFGLTPNLSANVDSLVSLRARTQSDCFHPALAIADPAVVGAVAAPAPAPPFAQVPYYSTTIAFPSVPAAFSNVSSSNLEDPAIISAVSARNPTVQTNAMTRNHCDSKDLVSELFNNLSLTSAPSSSTPAKGSTLEGNSTTPPKPIFPTSPPNSVPVPLLSSPLPHRPNFNLNRPPLPLFPQPLGQNMVPRIPLVSNAPLRLPPTMFVESSLAQRLRAPLPLLAPPMFRAPVPAVRLPSPQVFAKLPRPMQVQLMMQANMQLQMAHRFQAHGARPMGAPTMHLFPTLHLAAQQQLAMPPAMMPPVPLLSNAPIIALQQRTAQHAEINISPRFVRQQRAPEQHEFYYMTKTERDWVIRVQLLQLHMKNPFVEDYYYLHWTKAQQSEASEPDDLLAFKGQQAAAAAESPAKDSKNSARSASKIYGPKIDYDRRAQALLKDMTFFERKYEPKFTTGTLGRVTTVSTNAPRTILNLKEETPSDESAVDSSLTGDSSSAQDVSLVPARFSAADRSRVYKQCLLELERLAALWLDIEELDARLTDSFPKTHQAPLDAEDNACNSPVDEKGQLEDERNAKLTALMASFEICASNDVLPAAEISSEPPASEGSAANQCIFDLHALLQVRKGAALFYKVCSLLEPALLVAALGSALRSSAVVLAVQSSGRCRVTLSTMESEAAAASARAARLSALLARLPLNHCCTLLEQLLERASQPISECCLKRSPASLPSARLVGTASSSLSTGQQLAAMYTSLHSKLSTALPSETPLLFLWLQNLFGATLIVQLLERIRKCYNDERQQAGQKIVAVERVQSLLTLIGRLSAERGAPVFDALETTRVESDEEPEGTYEPPAVELGAQHPELLAWLRTLIPPAFPHEQLVYDTSASIRVLNTAW